MRGTKEGRGGGGGNGGFEIREVSLPVGFWYLRMKVFFKNGVCCFGCVYEMLFVMRSSVPCEEWDGVEKDD